MLRALITAAADEELLTAEELLSWLDKLACDELILDELIWDELILDELIWDELICDELSVTELTALDAREDGILATDETVTEDKVAAEDRLATEEKVATEDRAATEDNVVALEAALLLAAKLEPGIASLATDTATLDVLILLDTAAEALEEED